jgi:hypothetical protein
MAEKKNWDQCDAFARSLGDDGKERTIFCTQKMHSAPNDSSEWHYDEDLDIYWKYAEDFYNDDE